MTIASRILCIAIAAGLGIAFGLACCCGTAPAAQRGDGRLAIEVVDSETGQPIAARLHIKNSRGRPLSMRRPDTAEFGGHFYLDGSGDLPFRMGQYTFELDAGLEYRTLSGHFEIERHAHDTKRLEVKRFADLAKEGWYGGDLDVTRRQADLPLIMRAEGLSIVEAQEPATTTKAARRPVAGRSDSFTARERPAAGAWPTAKLVQRPGGELLLYQSAAATSAIEQVELRESSPHEHSSLSTTLNARKRDRRIIARTPYAWDLPVWLAGGELDAIQLIHHHALRTGVVDNEQDGRPRDRTLFPGRSGNGRWSETVYYHVLDCGLRIPPVAGSGSGTNDNPVGTNRVYVHCGDTFSRERWWDGLEAGRVFVTNGPLLRPMVEGHAPGYLFRIDEGETLSLEIGLDLATRVPVEYLQVVKNGKIESEVRLADWTKQKGHLPPIAFNASGWFLVRAVTNNTETYQFASSGPYYVEQAGRPRTSRRSVRFFLDWITIAEERLRKLSGLDSGSLQKLIAEQTAARRYFEELLAKANAD
jgi:hypothetical protein